MDAVKQRTVLEVCIDSIESLAIAIDAGADRIELCNSLMEGGLTPSAGYARKAIELSSIPVFPIIRHRGGDFVFSEDEIDLMVEDIRLMKRLGAPGVVVGALTPEGAIHQPALLRFVEAAQGIDVTFHRAFDLCIDPVEGLEVLIQSGCSRLLTSGQAASAQAGIDSIRALVRQAEGRIEIMPGAGIHQGNVEAIVSETGVKEVHLSGKTTRASRMIQTSEATMGDDSEADSLVTVTDFQKVRAVVDMLRGC